MSAFYGSMLVLIVTTMILESHGEEVTEIRISEVNFHAETHTTSNFFEFYNEGGNETAVSDLRFVLNGTSTDVNGTEVPVDLFCAFDTTLTLPSHGFLVFFDDSSPDADIHLPLNNSLVVPIPFCSSWEFPEMEEFSFCLTVEINFVHFIRVKIGEIHSERCAEIKTEYSLPPTGSSIQTNLNVPIPDTARGTRPNNGPFAAVMFCLPTPGSPPGSDCFQPKEKYWSVGAFVSLAVLILLTLIVFVILVTWFLRHRREIATAKKLKKAQRDKKGLVDVVFVEEEQEEQSSSSSTEPPKRKK